MPLTRSKVPESVQSKEQLSREMRQKRLALFIQQFEKEAQERLNDLEVKMENLLGTVDKVFSVELMKMPPSLKNTLLKDLTSEEGISASEVSIVMSESCEMSQPLRRVLYNNKRGKSTDTSPASSTSAQKSSSKAPKSGKGTKRTRTLVGSNSAGNLSASSGTVKRTQSCSMSRYDQTVSKQKTPKLRSVMSAGDLQCSVAGSAAHITVTTARGQIVSFSEENKDEINWDLLDDVALCHIQKLSSLMDYLSRQSRSQQ
ncbi:borealin-2 isoform X1 [Melanotaenia boesemani]|uniref:borealin-2 isoform X1 n=1 Tax=Melanotaenia boesemani TaxID=1250792 RepID=UPI001C043A23|nr:borealin-2 isoform X1 [Melanotaenia boesemani]